MSRSVIVQGRPIPSELSVELTEFGDVTYVLGDDVRVLSSQFVFTRKVVRIDGVSAVKYTELTNLLRKFTVDFALVANGICWSSIGVMFVILDRKIGNYGMLVSDMDSTLITIECIDEIADMLGNPISILAFSYHRSESTGISDN